MTQPDTSSPELLVEQFENALLERIEALPEGVHELGPWALAALDRLPGDVRGALFAVLVEGLLESEQPAVAWQLVARRADLASTLPRRELVEIARDALPGDHAEAGALLEAAGLASDSVPVRDAIARLVRLTSFQPDAICRHGSWGLGTIRDVYPLQGEMEVDFESKTGHVLQLRFAADTLEAFPPEHVLARRVLALDALREEAARDPGGLLRQCLRDAGGVMQSSEIADWLKGSVVADGAWAKWWTAARAAVRNDAFVISPARRSDPWVLSERAVSPGELFDQELQRTRAPVAVLALIDDLRRDAPGEFTDERRERMRGAVADHARRRPSPPSDAMLVLVGEAIGIEPDRINSAAASLHDPFTWVTAVSGLASARVGRLTERLWEGEGQDAFRATVFSTLNQLPARCLSQVLQFLLDHGHGAEAAGILAGHVTDGSAEAEILIWIAADPARAQRLGLPLSPLLVRRSLAAIERPHGGDRRRAQRELTELFARPATLRPLLGDAPVAEVEFLVDLVRRSGAVGLLLQRSLLAAFVKTRPEIEEYLASSARRHEEQPVSPNVGSQCSWRTYHRIEADLRNILEVQIPANSADLAEAISHGDLSENHQYEAAKERQAVLNSRRDELQSLLDSLRPTDFRDVESRTVRPGTTVEYRVGDDAPIRRVHVLGLHDSDPERSILGADTPLAQALLGLCAGDATEVPGEEGKRPAVVTSVSALPSDLLHWITPHE